MIGNRASASAADRMRMSRKRRRNGLHHIAVLLHETEMIALSRKGIFAPSNVGTEMQLKTPLAALSSVSSAPLSRRARRRHIRIWWHSPLRATPLHVTADPTPLVG
jgi:hypothetical protein